MLAFPRPAEHTYGLDHRDGDRVVRPHSPVEQVDIVLRDLLAEIGGRGRGRQRCVNGRRPVVRPEPLMMRRLVDVNGLRNRIPCGNHQTGPGMANPSIAQDILERVRKASEPYLFR